MPDNIETLPPEVEELIHPPHDPHDSRVFAELDRGRSVLGASQIDELLETILVRSILVNGEDAELLFDPDRPLGAFGTKIRLAQLNALLGDDFIAVLNHIRKL